MAEKKAGILKVPEKFEDQVLFAEMAKQILEQKKAEHDDILHKITLAKAKLIQIEEACKQTQANFNQRLALEKQQFDNERVKRLNEIAIKEERFAKLGESLSGREMMVKEQENTLVKVAEERKELYDLRVEVEKLKNANEIELDKTSSLQIEAQGKLTEMLAKDTLLTQKLKELQNGETALVTQRNELTLKEKDIQLQIENLAKIREEIKPKIEELEKLKANNEATLKAIELRAKEVDVKIEQDRQFLEKIVEQKAELKTKEIDLITRSEEVLRKEIQAEAGKK